MINLVNYYQATDLNLALALQTSLGKILGVSAVFGYSRYANLNVGTGLSIGLGPVQVFALTEALFGSTTWRSAEMGQVQLAVSQLYVLKLMAQGYQAQEVPLRQVGVEYSQAKIQSQGLAHGRIVKRLLPNSDKTIE